MPFYSLDTSAQIASVRREQVLTKLNPMLTSLAKEEFPDAHRQLFGTGFEQRLKTCSKIEKQQELESRFFEEEPPGDQQGAVEAANSLEASSHSTVSSSQPGTAHKLREGEDEVGVILLPKPRTPTQ